MNIRLWGFSILLPVLVGCGSAIPADMLTFLEVQYPNATITYTSAMRIGQGRESQNVTNAWCAEIANEPSPVVVYRDDTGLHLFNAWEYGIATCSEFQIF